MKSFVGDLVFTCDRIQNTLNSALISTSDNANYLLITFVLLSYRLSLIIV